MITFKTVTKQFKNGDYGLKDISFQIDPGELTVITGPSGSGKTTLMRLLTREYKPTEGEIEFEGQMIHNLSQGKIHNLRRKVGVVFQDYKLLHELNVWENIALSLYIMGKSQKEIEERVTDLLGLVQMEEKAWLFPSQLSGGEAQRISIARALATAPSVIFADEPTGNLDAETSANIAKLLHKINELGTTILLATHDSNVLDIFSDHRHLHLNKGVLEEDTGNSKQTVGSRNNKVDKSESSKDKNKDEKSSEELDQTKEAKDEDTKKDKSSKVDKSESPPAEEASSGKKDTQTKETKKTRFKLPKFFGK